MSYMITAECVNCGACEMECPVRAITPHADQYFISAETCVDCDGYFDIPRCKWACPVNACVPERDNYLFKAASLVNKGFAPVVFTKNGKQAGEMLKR